MARLSRAVIRGQFRCSTITSTPCWRGRAQQPRERQPCCATGRRFTATVSADNVAMTGLLRKMGAKMAGRSRGTMEYEVTLEAVDDYSLDWWFRCVDDSSVLAWP